MPHRGRLNVLCTLLGKQPGSLFAEMGHAHSQWHVGDVPFHLGQSSQLSFPQPVRPSLTSDAFQWTHMRAQSCTLQDDQLQGG